MTASRAVTLLAGLDIGGTKCAVSLGQLVRNGIEILSKRRFPTPETPAATLDRFHRELTNLLYEQANPTLAAIGISCGGPLDSRRGLVLSPPNLPGWDKIDVVTPFQEWFGVATAVQNDANACALAEWQWGAGRGCQNMVFLTFGTGMGAGLILNGRLYSGTNDLAGEVGHIRLRQYGPVGFGKLGSFEGFCSGGGIARLAQTFAEAQLQTGSGPTYCPTWDDLPQVTAEKVGLAAQNDDPLARHVWQVVAEHLGQGLAILIDILNPERIVIGSIYGRQQAILEPIVRQTMQQEALALSLAVCDIVPAGLGERVGDHAAFAVAQQLLL